MVRLGDARLPDLIHDELKAGICVVIGNTRAFGVKFVRQDIEVVKQVTKRPRETVVVINLGRDPTSRIPWQPPNDRPQS